MIELRPFRAWRPSPDKAHLVASRSYVSYSEEKLREKLNENPFSFLHIIHPDHGTKEKLGRFVRFGNVRKKWEQFLASAWYERDQEACYYLYEQSHHGRVSRGLVAAVSVADYHAGRIKVHEHTLEKREGLFKDYLNTTGINAEPVLLAIPGQNELGTLLSDQWALRPDVDFSTTDMVRHRIWAIKDPAVFQRIEERFSRVEALYIADGHHRLASSARLSEEPLDPNDPKQWCMAFIVPQDQLHIHNFDRAITSLAGMETAEFIQAVEAVGEVQALSGEPVSPPDQGCVHMCTRQGWFRVQLPAPSADVDPSERLDAFILSEAILGPVLEIHDLRTDPHVKFIPGHQGVSELSRMVAEGEAAVAFNLRPVQFHELKDVSDSGGCMPPKSTYIEPKLRSGLTVYSLEEH